MSPSRKNLFIAGLCLLLCLPMRLYAQGETKIEGFPPPKPALPPSGPDFDPEEKAAEDLERKRRQRQEREKTLNPPEPPYELQRRKKLLKEALIPRHHRLMFEISAVSGIVSTRTDRERYSAEPTSHFNVFYRSNAKKKYGKAGPWFGLRVAPFAGSGLYKKRPGSYGLTYFGPMIGVGKIDPAQTEDGDGLRAEKEADIKIPSVGGWVIGGGIAAVSRAGKTNEEDPEEESDFKSKGIAFDSPGLWVEGRYLRILYGAVGYNVIFGVQTGRNKEFIYAGIGFSGWD